MANEYLLKEYELCFEQLRFYDTRQEGLLKYLCSLTAAVATAQFAVYQLLHGATAEFLIRGYLMKVAAEGFEKNQMYTSTNFPALKPLSVHTFQLLGATLISSLFAAASAYGLFAFLSEKLNVVMAGAAFLVVFIVEAGGGILHLHFQGRSTADRAIHHVRDEDRTAPPGQSAGASTK
jgi:hypothetical protein